MVFNGALLAEILFSYPGVGLLMRTAASNGDYDVLYGAQDGRDGTRYIYFGEHRPVIWSTGLPTDSDNYDVDLIDSLAMTGTPAKKIAAPIPHPTRHGAIVTPRKPDAAFGVELPGKPSLALRVRRRAQKATRAFWRRLCGPLRDLGANAKHCRGACASIA